MPLKAGANEMMDVQSASRQRDDSLRLNTAAIALGTILIMVVAGGWQRVEGFPSDERNDHAVSFANPGAVGVDFNGTANATMKDAQPIDVITWTVEPTLSPGELVAAGVVKHGARLFSPRNGEGSAFSVYYKGHDESLVELLPDIGPLHVWNTTFTVAPTEWELEGETFKFRAYSPLFMDADPSALELRVYGYDGAGQAALLAVQRIGTRDQGSF